MNFGIFFDLDGTLADTALDLCYACNHTLEKWHLESVSYEEICQSVSLGIKAMLSLRIGNNLLSQYPRDSLMRQEFLNFYNDNICTKTKSFPYALVLLKKLKESGFKIAVVTGKYHHLAINLLDKLELLPFIDLVVGSDECKKAKPAPDSLLLALNKLDIKAQNCIYIGDHENDIKAADNCQMSSIAAAWGYGIYDCGDPKLWHATYVANDLSEVLDLVCHHFHGKCTQKSSNFLL